MRTGCTVGPILRVSLVDRLEGERGQKEVARIAEQVRAVKKVSSNPNKNNDFAAHIQNMCITGGSCWWLWWCASHSFGHELKSISTLVCIQSMPALSEVQPAVLVPSTFSNHRQKALVSRGSPSIDRSIGWNQTPGRLFVTILVPTSHGRC